MYYDFSHLNPAKAGASDTHPDGYKTERERRQGAYIDELAVCFGIASDMLRDLGKYDELVGRLREQRDRA